MASRQVTLTVTIGETVLGLWCERCALPSRVEVPLYILSSHGVRELKPVGYCTEHGRD